MRPVRGTALVFAAMLAILPAHPAESQIGGLIKKKAVDAAKGKDGKADAKTVAKDDGPIKSQFDKECGPVTPDEIERFLKGLQAEAAAREAYQRRLAATKPDAEVEACRQKEAPGPEAIALIQRGLANGGTTEYVQKQMEKNREDLEKLMVKKCGDRRSPVEHSWPSERTAAHKAGAKESGLSEECYDKLKEFTLAFCKALTPDQQKIATEQGIRVPGQGQGIFWVFTADEAKAMFPHCGELVKSVNATSNDVK